MGRILNIQRFCTDDGDGIRTTVFFKGCPLRCLWCHNPESQRSRPQIGFDEAKCVGCGKCVALCEKGCHALGAKREFFRDSCDGCGKCVTPTCDALELFGEEMSAEEIMSTVIRDRDFYEASGGGLTLSGGEPLSRSDLALEILRLAKAQEISTAVETCGYVSREILEAVAPYVDTFLYDIKETDSERHREFTGMPNELILENLKYLSERGSRIVLRCPIIPGLNDRDGHFSAIGELAELDGVVRVEIEPYHSFGEGKYARLGIDYALKGKAAPTDETVRQYKEKLQKFTSKPVLRMR